MKSDDDPEPTQEDIKSFLYTWLKMPSHLEGRRYLEDHLELLDPKTDVLIEDIIIDPHTLLSGFEQEGESEQTAQIRQILHSYKRLLYDARERGSTVMAVRAAYVNFYGGFVLDVPPWFKVMLDQLNTLEHQGRPDQTVPARRGLLKEMISRAQNDADIGQEILADLKLLLFNALFDSIEMNRHQTQQIQEEEIELLEAALQAYTLDHYSIRFASIQDILGGVYAHRIAGERRTNLEEAIACYTRALQVYTLERFPEEYATDQYNLGNTYLVRVAGSSQENLEEAIACYTRALQVCTLERFAEIYARIQSNLAYVYSHRVAGNRAVDLEESINCDIRALQVYTLEKYPEDYARVQNNLGVTYTSRIVGERRVNFEEAIACHTRALKVYTPDAFPIDYAWAQHNLGAAYSNRIAGERRSNLEKALVCFQEALRFHTPDSFPTAYAKSQRLVGIVYCERIAGERGANLEEAIACFTRALRIYTRYAFSEEHATTQISLGICYSVRIVGDRRQNLEEAIACYTRTLQILTPDTSPERYSTAQYNLGNTYRQRIEGERSANLEEAIACFTRALQVRTLDTAPETYAKILLSLGEAYSERIVGERKNNLEETITCYTKALQVFTLEASPVNQARLHYLLGQTYLERMHEEHSANLEEAIACFMRALQVYTRYAYPEEYARTQLGLGTAYRERIRGDKSKNLEEAITCHINALDVFTLQEFPEEYAAVQHNLGATYLERGKNQLKTNLEEAIACFHQALQVYTPMAYPEKYAGTQYNLGIAYLFAGEGEREANLQEAISCFNRALQVYTVEAFPDSHRMVHVALDEALVEAQQNEALATGDIHSLLPAPLCEAIENDDGAHFSQALKILAPEKKQLWQIWTVLDALARRASLEGRVEATKLYRQRQREMLAALDNSDDTETLLEFIVDTVALAAQGHTGERKIIEAALPLLNAKDWRPAIERILQGERDWDALIVGLDIQAALLVHQILQAIALPPESILAEASSKAAEQSAASLPLALREAMERDDHAAFEEAFESLPPSKQGEALKALLLLDAQQKIPSAVLQQYEPFLQAIGDIARGISSQKEKVETALVNLEEDGWQLKEVVQRIWAGERETAGLTAGLDELNTALVLRLLEIIAQPFEERWATEEVVSSLPPALAEAIKRSDDTAFEQGLEALALDEQQTEITWTRLGTLVDVANLEGKKEAAKAYSHYRENFVAFTADHNTIDSGLEILIVVCAVAALRSSYVLEDIRTQIPQWEERGWHIRSAVERILVGVRDWNTLVVGLKVEHALVIWRILQTIVLLDSKQVTKERSEVSERFIASLPHPIRGAVEQDEPAALEHALESVTDWQQAGMIWTALGLLGEIAELEGRMEAAQRYRRRERDAFAAFWSKQYPLDHKFEKFIFQTAIAAKGNVLMQSIIRGAMEKYAAAGREGQSFVAEFDRILEGERDWHRLVKGEVPFTALVIVRVLETIEELSEAGDSTEDILASLPPPILDTMLHGGEDVVSMIEVLQSLSGRESLALRAGMKSIMQATEKSDLELPGASSSVARSDRTNGSSDALGAAIVAAARGDEQMQRGVQTLLAQAGENGHRLAGVVQRIWRGERDVYRLVEDLDFNSALLIQRVLETLTQPADAQSIMTEQILASLPFTIRQIVEQGDTPSFDHPC